MSLEKGFNLLLWSRVKLILMEFSHIISHSIAMRVDDKVFAKIVHKLLIMLTHDLLALARPGAHNTDRQSVEPSSENPAGLAQQCLL